MTRTNIDIDDDACAEVMHRYGLSTKREAVNFALRQLAAEPSALRDTSVAYTPVQSVQGYGGNDYPARGGQMAYRDRDVTYRRATIEEARRMRGDTDFNRRPTRDEWLYRPLVPIRRPSREEFLDMRGSGWHGDLEEMRRNPPELEAWLNRPDDETLSDTEDGSPQMIADTSANDQEHK